MCCVKCRELKDICSLLPTSLPLRPNFLQIRCNAGFLGLPKCSGAHARIFFLVSHVFLHDPPAWSRLASQPFTTTARAFLVLLHIVVIVCSLVSSRPSSRAFSTLYRNCAKRNRSMRRRLSQSVFSCSSSDCRWSPKEVTFLS